MKRKFQGLTDLLCKFTKFSFEIALAIAALSLITLFSLRAPEYYNLYMRKTVGSKVYMIRDSAESGGGTGFAVQAPSGQTYILTNDHVCEVSGDGLTVLVSNDDGKFLRRKIIAHDPNSDLCLVEALPGTKGLEVADRGPNEGETLMVVGHPKLLPLTTSRGEMIGREDVMIPIGPISVLDGKREYPVPAEEGGILEKNCKLPKHLIMEMEAFSFFGPVIVKFCVMYIQQAYMTNAIILGGNSGSPVVNFWGELQGVAFAAADDNWGAMISHDDITHFLENY